MSTDKVITYTGLSLVIIIWLYFLSVLTGNIGYEVFYKDEVKATIREMVKLEVLKDGYIVVPALKKHDIPDLDLR